MDLILHRTLARPIPIRYVLGDNQLRRFLKFDK
jgi:hypothetical protein